MVLDLGQKTSMWSLTRKGILHLPLADTNDNLYRFSYQRSIRETWT